MLGMKSKVEPPWSSLEARKKKKKKTKLPPQRWEWASKDRSSYLHREAKPNRFFSHHSFPVPRGEIRFDYFKRGVFCCYNDGAPATPSAWCLWTRYRNWFSSPVLNRFVHRQCFKSFDFLKKSWMVKLKIPWKWRAVADTSIWIATRELQRYELWKLAAIVWQHRSYPCWIKFRCFWIKWGHSFIENRQSIFFSKS